MATESVSVDAAWGLRFPGLTTAAHVLVPATSDHALPEADITVNFHCDPPADQSTSWNDTGMHVPLVAGGQLRIQWPYRVQLGLAAQPLPECVVQPHLTTAAAAIQLRRGMQPFHAGGVITGGGVWGVLGAKEAGKSSAMALASLRDIEIVTDDLLVVTDGAAYAGPRCIDLRPEAARELGIGTGLGVVGLRERWRVYTSPCAMLTPMAGFVVPEWGADDLRPLSPVERLQTLFAHSALLGITMNDPDQYLSLAALPMFAWSRPKDWATADTSFDLLLKQLEHA
jgi:hypothetical protein